ncbi:MAG TPA: GntR family transcriptional regulator [Methylomirabilota bacterium]|jgi:GntR family transcriptional regulator|nr:GntR family transcriptional regulator [Methylomirabilota bacterium]
MTVVSRTRAAPLHDQIRRSIEERIESGDLRPGDQLPTEHEYAETLGVSIAPVRQALLDLANRGLVVRTKGRGTFVAESALEVPVSLLESFTDALRARNVPFTVTVLDQGIVTDRSDVAIRLGLPADAPMVRLRRVARIRGEVVAALDAYLDGDRFGRLGGIDGFGEGRSLYRTLEQEFGIRVGQATGTLEVERSNDAQSELLGVTIGTPVLLARSVTEDADGRPIEVAEVLYRGDRFIFRIDSRR